MLWRVELFKGLLDAARGTPDSGPLRYAMGMRTKRTLLLTAAALSASLFASCPTGG